MAKNHSPKDSVFVCSNVYNIAEISPIRHFETKRITMRFDYDAIIIGAGIGGLSCAAILANKGMKVLVCESSDRAGGCCSSFTRRNACLDLGAAIFHYDGFMRKVFEESGIPEEEIPEMRRVEPGFAFWPEGGDPIDFPSSEESVAASLSKWSISDAKKFLNIAAELKRLRKANLKGLDEGSLSSARGNPYTLKSIAHMAKYRHITCGGFLKSLLENDDCVSAMSYCCNNAGISPHIAPIWLLKLMAGQSEGVVYPVGGSGSIPKAFVNAIEKNGGEVSHGCRVRRILLDRGIARGIRLAGGDEIYSRTVISDVSIKRLYLELIGEEHFPRRLARTIYGYALSPSIFSAYLFMSHNPGLERQNTVLFSGYKKTRLAWEDMSHGRFTAKGNLMISCPLISDSGLAGDDPFFIRITSYAPFFLMASDWRDEDSGFAEALVREVELRTGLSIEDKISEMLARTPVDLASDTSLPGGAAYGLMRDHLTAGPFLPSAKSRIIEGLFLCGASVCEYGSVHSAAMSGMIVANSIGFER